MELCQYMLHNRLMPAQGTEAQLALAEVARPIRALLDEEISLRFERIDSLKDNKGHRPYEYERGKFEGHVGPVATGTLTPSVCHSPGMKQRTLFGRRRLKGAAGRHRLFWAIRSG